MKNVRPSRILSAIIALSTSLPAVAAGPHDHDHEAAAPHRLQLDKGRKWPTDAPLRQSMTTLRTELTGKLHAIHKDSLTREQYAALGSTIESQVGVIVSQCKLEPEADAMLHIVVADLVGAADVMQGKAAGRPAEAAHRAVKAVNDYGRYFAHPGWVAIR